MHIAQTSSPAKKKQRKKFPVHRQRWWKQEWQTVGKCEASKNRPYNIKFFTSRKNSSQKKPTRQFAGKMVEGRQPRFSNGFESDKQ